MFYLLLSVGVSINFHYCDGKLAGMTLVKSEQDSTCQTNVENEGCCKTNNLSDAGGDEDQPKDDCCDDEQFFLQFDNDQKLIQTLRLAKQQPVVTISQIWKSGFSIDCDNADNKFIAADLPPPNDEPLWLLNCSLRYHC